MPGQRGNAGADPLIHLKGVYVTHTQPELPQRKLAAVVRGSREYLFSPTISGYHLSGVRT